MNVHRYRKLEGSDPKRYELIQKIQTLQKRLIVKTESVVEKDLLLQEKEKLYAELKNLLVTPLTSAHSTCAHAQATHILV